MSELFFLLLLKKTHLMFKPLAMALQSNNLVGVNSICTPK